MSKEYTTKIVFGKEFKIGESKKFDKDLETVETILNKEELTEIDRYILLSVYQTAYHNSGKVIGTTTLDSSAHNCIFCEKMQKAAEKNPDHICNKCYDKKNESYRKYIKNRHTLNLLIMSSVRFTVKELSRLTVTNIIRINSSGDIENQIHAENMVNVAYAFPWARVGLWTKNKKDVTAAIDKLGKPENLILVQSSPIKGRPARRAKYFDYVFTVYPDKESTEKAIAAGACSCNGKECRACGYKCYFGTWEKGANIAEVLRK